MFGEQGFGQWLPFVVFGGVTVMLFIRLRLRRSASQVVPSREEGLERLKENNRRKSLEGMLVDIHDVNREMTARVDNKLAVISTLAKQVAQAQSKVQSQVQSPSPAGHISSVVTQQLEQRIVELEKRLGLLESKHCTSAQLVQDNEQQKICQKRHRTIFDLFEKGLNPLEIAEQVQRQRGEIELILGLGGVDAGTKTST